MKALNDLDDRLRLLFEYTGDYDLLQKTGIEIESMFGGDCYSSVVSSQELEKLMTSLDTLRVISMHRIMA